MSDITPVDITTALAGTITTGALVLYILQNIKAIFPGLQGRRAEAAGGVASFVAVTIGFVLAKADWYAPETYALLFVSWMSVWVAARAGYAMLFRVSVPGVPPSSEATATGVADPQAESTTLVTPTGRIMG
jgi:hypothetical protein